MMIKLNRREMLLVSLMLLVIATVAYLQLFYNPHQEKLRQLTYAIQQKTNTLSEMLLLKAEYHSLIHKSEQLTHYYNNRPSNFTLFSFLERLAGEAQIKENIVHITPSTRTDRSESPYKISQVELKLQNINMAQLSSYLFNIETSGNMVFIRKMSLSKNRSGAEVMEVLLLVETWEKT